MEVEMVIVTDSAADMPREEREAYRITVAPLIINFPEGQVSAEDLTPDEFYNRLKAMDPDIPTTSQPSAGAFAEIYRKFTDLKEDILSIHISSGLSGTLEAARLGAQQVPEIDITVVDTLTLSGGERFQVLAAAMGARAGMSKQAILERLDQIRASTETIYTLETLTYLARGGRIGRVQALAGSLLKLKPIIKVDRSDGKYSTAGKQRTMLKALDYIREHLVELYGQEEPLWICVLHGQFLEQAKLLAGMLDEKLNISKIEILRISPVLGVHTGPGIVGAAAVPIHLMQGLD
jgi:DegV family protein with EDD domain